MHFKRFRVFEISGLGIRQLSVYVVFCNKDVIENIFFVLSTSLVARSNKIRLYCLVK